MIDYEQVARSLAKKLIEKSGSEPDEPCYFCGGELFCQRGCALIDARLVVDGAHWREPDDGR